MKTHIHFSFLRELLQTINHFEREQPFGNNTIQILARNIERLYRESGYLYATVKIQQRGEEVEDRTDYFIQIREEGVVDVDEVRIKGLSEKGRIGMPHHILLDLESLLCQSSTGQ